MEIKKQNMIKGNDPLNKYLAQTTIPAWVQFFGDIYGFYVPYLDDGRQQTLKTTLTTQWGIAKHTIATLNTILWEIWCFNAYIYTCYMLLSSISIFVII